MAKNEERRSVLDKLLNRDGAADEIAKELEDTVEMLENDGVEHKALDINKVEAALVKAVLDIQNYRVETATKANVSEDDMIDFVMLAVEQIAEAGPEADAREVASELVRAVFASADEPTEEIDVEIENEDRAGEFDDDDDDDEETKARKLDLIETVSDDTAATLKAIEGINSTLETFKGMPDNMTAITERLQAVEAQLASRPRASENGATVFNADALKRLQDMAEKAESGAENRVTAYGLPNMLSEPTA